MNTHHLLSIFCATSAVLIAPHTALAECDDIVKHPTKVPFGAHIYTTSSLERPNPQLEECEKLFEELVPIEADRFALETFCEAVSVADVMVDHQPAAYAAASGRLMMHGEAANDGFWTALHQVGQVEHLKGETSVRMDAYILYPFEITRDTHFTFVHESTAPQVDDAQSMVELIYITTGERWDMTGVVNDLPENAEAMKEGSYELRILGQFDQSGADNYLEVASDRVEIQFFCKYDLLPADINNDGAVNGLDLARILGSFNSYEFDADINGDGKVDGADLAMLLGSWTG